MNNTIIPVGNKVVGDITSCKIENQLISIDRTSATSLTQSKTYASYDVCSKEIIQTYTVPEATGYAVGLGLVIAVVFVFICMIFMTPSDPYYPIRF